METILAYAQQLVYILLSLMPSQYQKDNLQTMLGLFLEVQGHPLPQHSRAKSASTLSRFLNINTWSTRKLIRTTLVLTLDLNIGVSSTRHKSLVGFKYGR